MGRYRYLGIQGPFYIHIMLYWVEMEPRLYSNINKNNELLLKSCEKVETVLEADFSDRTKQLIAQWCEANTERTLHKSDILSEEIETNTWTLDYFDP